MRLYMALLLAAASVVSIGLTSASSAVRRSREQHSSYFPTLTVSAQPFVSAGLDNSSLHAWSGSPSPILRFTAANDLPLAASFVVSTANGATLTSSHPDAYSRLGVIDSGSILHFSGTLAHPGSSVARVTFSLVDAKALAVNLLLPATPASSLNRLISALQTGPGATLLFELRREITKALSGKASRIVLVKNVSALLTRFGADRANRKWLLDNLGANVSNVVKLALWAKDVAIAAGGYAGLAHIGVGGTETATLGSEPTTAAVTRVTGVLPADRPLIRSVHLTAGEAVKLWALPGADGKGGGLAFGLAVARQQFRAWAPYAATDPGCVPSYWGNKVTPGFGDQSEAEMYWNYNNPAKRREWQDSAREDARYLGISGCGVF